MLWGRFKLLDVVLEFFVVRVRRLTWLGELDSVGFWEYSVRFDASRSIC